MLRIAVLLLYVYVVTTNQTTFADDDLLFVLADVIIMMFCMAFGLYHMRAESGGSHSLFEMAGKIATATQEEHDEFRQKYMAARESLYVSGIFFWLLLILVLANDKYLVSGNALDYQLTLAVMIPVLSLFILETVLQLALKIKAGIRIRLPIEQDLWLTWFTLSMLGILAVMLTCSFYDSDVGFWIFSSLLLAGILSNAVALAAHYLKAYESSRQA